MILDTEECDTSQSQATLKQDLENEEYRYAYAEDFLNTWVATQIVTLREQRGMSQTRLGELIGTKQPGVSRLEDINHSTWKTETLKRIARALGVRLKITFETFGDLLIEDERFCRDFLKRPDFKADPAFAPLNIDGCIERVPPQSELSREAVKALLGDSGNSTNTAFISDSPKWKLNQGQDKQQYGQTVSR